MPDDTFRWMLTCETPRLRRFATALTGDPERADDLVQDTLERALRKRRLWAGTGSMRSWLFKLLYRVHANQRSRASTEATALTAVEHRDAGSMPANQDSHVEVLNVSVALRALPLEQRDAVLLVGLEGMAYDEAADVLGIRVGTLKSRLYRGREALWAVRRGDVAVAERKVR